MSIILPRPGRSPALAVGGVATGLLSLAGFVLAMINAPERPVAAVTTWPACRFGARPGIGRWALAPSA